MEFKVSKEERECQEIKTREYQRIGNPSWVEALLEQWMKSDEMIGGGSEQEVYVIVKGLKLLAMTSSRI